MTKKIIGSSLDGRGSRRRRRRGRSLRILLFLLILGVGAYALAGFIGLPWLVERELASYAGEAPGFSASVGSLRVNPFTWTAEASALEIRSEQAGVALSAGRVTIDLTRESWRELRPVVAAIELEQAELVVGSLARLTALGRRLRSEPLLDPRIDRIDLVDSRVRVGDQLDLSALALTLRGLDPRADRAARFELGAVTATGASLTSRGTLAQSVDEAFGQVTLGDVDLAAVAGELGILALASPGGLLDLTANFAATDLLGRPAVELSDAELDLSELALGPVPGLSIQTETAMATAELKLGSSTAGGELGGRIEMDGLALAVRDLGAAPAQTFLFTDSVLLLAADTQDGMSINLEGRLAGADAAVLTLRIPAEPAMPRQVSLRATRVPASVLSAYAEASLGRAIASGDADVNLDYALTDGAVEGSLELVGRDLEFRTGPAAPSAGNTTPSADTGALDLAAALLEDNSGVIRIDLPFAGSGLAARDIASAALRARISALTASPFESLAQLTDGEPGSSSAVPFLPGDAALNDRAQATIARLAEILDERPRLGLRVLGGFDATADRDALAREQIKLHVGLATANPGAAAADAQSIDFGSPRVQDVLDEFAGERLPADRVSELASRFNCSGNLIPLCQRAYYEAVFNALVRNEEIAPTALTRLGRFRAITIADALQQLGIAEDRVEVVPNGDVVDSPYGIGLAVELTTAG
jgi:outer membrane protein OmpA-like peptidoglycan-associated protein